jgi:4'-phosphopantetheinyl transferase
MAGCIPGADAAFELDKHRPTLTLALAHLRCSSPTNLVLSEDEVHVWRADLNLSASRIEQLAQILSPDEQLRAGKFYFERDRKRFIAGRGILRTILSRYLDLDPTLLQFSYSSRGKPALANTDTQGTLCFNLSHSNALALYVLRRISVNEAGKGSTQASLKESCNLGIDLEHLRPMPDAEQLAKRFFSPREYAVISSLPLEQKQEAFFKGWTCKEAYLKAIGYGLAGLEQVEVSVTPGEPAALLSIQGDSKAASRWSLQQLIPAPGYMAALAVEGHDWHLNWGSVTEL